MAVYCSNCKTEYEDGVTICANCGEFITGEEEEAHDVNNVDAISRMFEEAKKKVEPGTSDAFASLSSYDSDVIDASNDSGADSAAATQVIGSSEISSDLIEDFNKGLAVDIPPGVPTDFDEESEQEFESNIEDLSAPPEIVGDVSVNIAQGEPDIMYDLQGNQVRIEVPHEADDFEEESSSERQSKLGSDKKSGKKRKEKKPRKERRKKILIEDSADEEDDTDVDSSVKETKKPERKKKSKGSEPGEKQQKKVRLSLPFLKKKKIEPAVSETEDNELDSLVEELKSTGDITLDGTSQASVPKPSRKKSKGKKKKKALKVKIPHAELLKRAVFTFLAVAVAFALGGLSLYLMFDLRYNNDVNSSASNAINAVLTKIPQGSSFFVNDIYVKAGIATTECIVNGTVSSKPGDYNTTYYRVTWDNDEKEKMVIYYAFDQSEYSRLSEGNEQEKIAASIMLNYHESYLSAMSEVSSGNEKWKKADAAYINFKLQTGKKGERYKST